MTEFSGRVIDGPWEGKSYASPRSYFQIAILPRMVMADWMMEDALAPVSVPRATYIWSRPLRGWVFDWTSVHTPHGRMVA